MGKGSRQPREVSTLARREWDRQAKLVVVERWMAVEFPMFGRWVSPDRAERIAARAAPGTFRVVQRRVPSDTWAQCDLTRKQIELPPDPVPIFVVLHELAHAWAPRAVGHSPAFLESYQYRVWEFWKNAALSRAFEATCKEIA